MSWVEPILNSEEIMPVAIAIIELRLSDDINKSVNQSVSRLVSQLVGRSVGRSVMQYSSIWRS